MNKYRLLVIIMLCFPFLSGCVPATTYVVSNNKPAKNLPKAELYYDLGITSYNQGNFIRSTEYLFKAVENFESRTKIAYAYIFIGANFFYREEISYAKKYFKKARLISPNIYPQRTDFPHEIINLFNATKSTHKGGKSPGWGRYLR